MVDFHLSPYEHRHKYRHRHPTVDVSTVLECSGYTVRGRSAVRVVPVMGNLSELNIVVVPKVRIGI